MLEEYVILFQLCAIQNYLYEYLKYKFTKNTFLKHEGIIQNRMFGIGEEVHSFLDTPKRTMYTCLTASEEPIRHILCHIIEGTIKGDSK